MTINKPTLFEHITTKTLLKQQVNEHAFNAFKLLREAAKTLSQEYKSYSDKSGADKKVAFNYKDRGTFEFEIQFGGDTLLFLLHSNVFEIPRAHPLMYKPYVDEDKERRFCGMISIYNFLTDSFTYQRNNDGGYMIGRMLVNKDNHFFIEGKREIAMIYHQFEKAVMQAEAAQNILTAAIEYTINFDVLIPPYDQVAYVAVGDITEDMHRGLATNKRMGFKFGEDKMAKQENESPK